MNREKQALTLAMALDRLVGDLDPGYRKDREKNPQAAVSCIQRALLTDDPCLTTLLETLQKAVLERTDVDLVRVLKGLDCIRNFLGEDSAVVRMQYLDTNWDAAEAQELGYAGRQKNGLYRYYALRGPIREESCPKSPGNLLLDIVHYSMGLSVDDAGHVAWGYLEYLRPLSGEICQNYGLMPAGWIFRQSA